MLIGFIPNKCECSNCQYCFATKGSNFIVFITTCPQVAGRILFKKTKHSRIHCCELWDMVGTQLRFAAAAALVVLWDFPVPGAFGTGLSTLCRCRGIWGYGRKIYMNC